MFPSEYPSLSSGLGWGVGLGTFPVGLPKRQQQASDSEGGFTRETSHTLWERLSFLLGKYVGFWDRTL